MISMMILYTHRSLRPRPAQEGADLFEGQPPEGRAYLRAGLGCRTAAPRRTDRRPRPAHGSGVPGLHQGREGGGPNGAAVEPHPRPGRGAGRSGVDHPVRPHRRNRGSGAAAASVAHDHHGRSRTRCPHAEADVRRPRPRA